MARLISLNACRWADPRFGEGIAEVIETFCTDVATPVAV